MKLLTKKIVEETLKECHEQEKGIIKKNGLTCIFCKDDDSNIDVWKERISDDFGICMDCAKEYHCVKCGHKLTSFQHNVMCNYKQEIPKTELSTNAQDKKS